SRVQGPGLRGLRRRWWPMDESTPQRKSIQLDLDHAAALVLFELLADFREETALVIPSEAERFALFSLVCSLESVLAEPFRPDYLEIVSEARKSLVPEVESE